MNVCTRDRARVLPRALRAAAGQSAAFPFEILVVDNGSSDDTRAVVERASAEHPSIRYVHEPETGLSRARNRGAAESRAPLLAYLDDDAEPVAGWLSALRAAFAETPAAIVGGPILARFEVPPPPWLTAHLSLLSCQDLGAERRVVDRPPYVFGANLAVRRDDLARLGGFDPSLGRLGRRLLQDEDTDLCERVLADGRSIVYEPRAGVLHWIPPERVTREYLRRRAFDTGRSVGHRLRRHRSGLGLAAEVAAKVAKLPAHALLWAAASVVSRRDVAVAHERSVLTTLGILAELAGHEGGRA
ncbi:MAG: glycosyltransferase family 2 protein [Candidatus Binatia bacterium]